MRRGRHPAAGFPAEPWSEDDEVTRLLQAVGRTPVRLPPEVRARVMSRVRVLARSPWWRSWTWATTPSVRLTPATLVFAAAAAVAMLLLVRPRPAPPPLVGRAPLAAAGSVRTRFVLVAPKATSVAVTGDFVNWDPKGIPLRAGAGAWAAEIELAPGVHHYVFIIDGTNWSPDPNATSQVDDGFGQQNSVLVVPARASD